MIDLGRVDYEDAFFVDCPAGASASDVLLGFFSSAPKIVKALMALRNGVVSIVGLKTERPNQPLDASMLHTGNRVGFFEIYSITSQSAVVGADDSHLNFRVLLSIQNDILTCKTQVQFNKALGKAYFFFVKPFHRWIVPMVLRSCVQRLRPPAAPRRIKA